MSKNCVVTGFNGKYFNDYGVSWLLSLLQTGFDPSNIIVFACDVPLCFLRKIEELGVTVILYEYKKDIRIETIQAISKLAKESENNFAYWDTDVYFQEDITEVFLEKDICVTKDSGFIWGKNEHWKMLGDAQNITDFIGAGDVHSFLKNYFSDHIKILPDTFNFCDVFKLKDIEGKLCFEDASQKVIHPLDFMKTKLVNQNIFFWERNSDLIRVFLDRSLYKKVLMHSK